MSFGMYLNHLNTLVYFYTDRYQDFSFEDFLKLDLDSFYIELSRKEVSAERFESLHQQLSAFQFIRREAGFRCIPPKEFYFAAANHLLKHEKVSRQVLFTELLFQRQNILLLLGSIKDPTLTNGSTVYGQAHQQYYENITSKFGMNDRFCYLEDHAEVISPVLARVADHDNLVHQLIKLDETIELEFQLSKQLA